MARLNGFAVLFLVFFVELHGLGNLGHGHIADFKNAVHGARDFAVKGFPGPGTCKGGDETGHECRNVHGFPLFHQDSALGHVKDGQNHLGPFGFGFHEACGKIR